MREGFVLIVVLVAIAALSLAALGYSEWMLTERQAVDLAGRQIQARLLAASGVELARAMLAADRETLADAGGWDDNPTCFRNVLVLDEDQARRRGRFTLLSPGGEEGSVRFGLANESARLNLNALVAFDKSVEGSGRQLLLGLPGMTEEIADAILDWLDSDDEPREHGAEADYYAALDPPYAPRNNSLASIEELLLVRGVTPQLLFGVDANRNGTIDEREAEAATLSGSVVEQDSDDRGWAACLTLYSRESLVNSEGNPRINVNQSDMQTLYEELSAVLDPAWATFIVAYRQQSEPYTEDAKSDDDTKSENGDGKDADGKDADGKDADGNKDDSSPKVETTPSEQPDLSVAGTLELGSVLDLIGQRVRVKYQGQEKEVILESPFADDPQAMRTYLPTLMDCLTTSSSSTISGRINLFHAPEAVLAAIPGLSGDVVVQIISRRASALESTELCCRHETWLLIEGLVTLEAMKTLQPLITTGGDVYRCQVVGYFDKDGPRARIEAVLDATTRPVGVLFWRDLTRLGQGYSAETLGDELDELLKQPASSEPGSGEP